ncbi:MAG: hypothetical protein AAF441_21625 [Pseudomonadota bacterium]
MKTNTNTLAGAAFASNAQIGLMRRQKAKPVRIQPNAVFALAFLLLPLVLVVTLNGGEAEANASPTVSVASQ